MIKSSCIKMVIAGTAALSLSGCLGNSNGGGAAGAGGGAAGAGGGAAGAGGGAAGFDAQYDKTLNFTPTLTPITGKAEYKGQIEVLTNQNPDNTKEAVYGDLEMAIDFAPGVSRPVSGTISNFAGQVGGEDVTIEGTLRTANAKASSPNYVKSSETDLTAYGGGIVTTTNMGATFNGDLVDPAGKMSGKADMHVSGQFTGDGGKGIFGVVGGGIEPATGPAFIAGGRTYAVKK